MKLSRRVWVLAAVGLSGMLLTALILIGWGLAGAQATTGSTVGCSVQPVLETVGSGLGGIVAEVGARQGDRVKAGGMVVRFDDSAVRARLQELALAETSAEDAMRGQRTVARIPDRLKRYLHETHPDVVDAEQAYVAALEAFDRAREEERAAAQLRLEKAAQSRVGARRRLDAVLQHAAPGELLALTAQLRKDRREAEVLLRQAERRAASDGVLDLLDLSKGDRVLPGSPVALIRLADEYACEFTGPTAGRLQTGMRLRGTLAGERPLLASVDSISRRPLPAAFRDKRDQSDQTVVRLRIHSTKKIEPEALARFLVP